MESVKVQMFLFFYIFISFVLIMFGGTQAAQLSIHLFPGIWVVLHLHDGPDFGHSTEKWKS